VGSIVERLMSLWTGPADEAAFATLYADPVRVNGVPLTVADLVARARALHATYSDVAFEVVDEIETPDRAVVGFRMRGRHTGPLDSPLGTVAPTGRTVEARVTDILVLDRGLVTDIWVVSDDLAVLRQLDAVTLTGAPGLP
jgi:predicted ester cyclase